tara:strand:+ start:2450 stop:2689 length:240 start_codon:yes stop_codon:yes gene_type:complete
MLASVSPFMFKFQIMTIGHFFKKLNTKGFLQRQVSAPFIGYVHISGGGGRLASTQTEHPFPFWRGVFFFLNPIADNAQL